MSDDSDDIDLEPFELNGYSAVFGGTDGWRIFDPRGNKMLTAVLRTRQDAASFMAGQAAKEIS